MDVAVTGSSGLVGTALVAALHDRGHRVRRVVRSGSPAADGSTVRWDPMAGEIEAARLDGVDGAVHLAGEGIGERRWSDEQTRRILESRTRGTDLLARTLAGLSPRPSVLVSASGVGYYGSQGDERLTESAPSGEGFTAEVARAWEAATAPAADAGIRVACARTGMVLSGDGGALPRMLPLFKLGLGGRMGSGRQWWSWIAIHDHVSVLIHLLEGGLAGPVNSTAPEPVTNGEFTRTLARVLHRPAVLPVPAFGPKLVLGRELGQELLFSSQRVVPAKLEADGFRFETPGLEGALRRVLGRPD